MNKNRVCQSCGMPLKNEIDYALNIDGTLNKEYCKYCFQNGKFTNDFTMEEMIEHNLKFLDEFNKDANTSFNSEEARKEMLLFFPSLSRWSK